MPEFPRRSPRAGTVLPAGATRRWSIASPSRSRPIQRTRWWPMPARCAPPPRAGACTKHWTGERRGGPPAALRAAPLLWTSSRWPSIPRTDPSTLYAGSVSSSATFRRDAFVSKLAPTGSRLVYSTYLGGGASDWGRGIAVDSQGSAFVTGSTESPDFPTARAIQPNFGGDRKSTRLNSSHGYISYAVFCLKKKKKKKYMNIIHTIQL